MYKIIILAFFLTLSGCSSSVAVGNKTNTAKTNTNVATVYVFNSVRGMKVSLEDLYVNGKKIGVTTRGGYTWFYLPAGMTTITMNDPVVKAQILTRKKLQLKKGKTYYLNYDLSGAPIMEMIPGAGPGMFNITTRVAFTSINKEKAQSLIANHKLFGNYLQ